MPQYSRHIFPKEKVCSMKRQTFRLLLLIAFIVLATAVTIALLAILTKKNLSDENTFGSTAAPCVEHVLRDPLSSDRSVHSSCRSKLPLASECSVAKEEEWIRYSRNSQGWNDILLMHTEPDRSNVSTIVSSPSFDLSPDTCSIQISFDFQLDSFEVFLNTTPFGIIPINVTSDQCHYGVFTNVSLLSELSSYNLVIASSSEVTSNITYGSITSHRCVEFQAISFSEMETVFNPSFAYIPAGDQSQCPFALFDNSVSCDWQNVVGLSNQHFNWLTSQPCIPRGVVKQDDVQEGSFLALTTDTDKPLARGFVISPIMEGGYSTARVSFWYVALCAGSTIRAYVTPSYHDVNGIAEGTITPVYERTLTEGSPLWTHKVLELPVSTSYPRFQVVMEVEISRDGNCSNFPCNSLFQEMPEEPLVALDELAVEARFETCAVSDNNFTFADCSFQNENNSFDFCLWDTSLPFGALPDPTTKLLFAHWKPNNRPNPAGSDHGPVAEHLVGRGYVITHSAILGASENYFRSPLLVANTQCSCQMSFMYLNRGIFAPRLQVNLVLGNGTESPLKKIRQWAVSGHQSNDWLEENVILNLPISTSFRIEFTAIDPPDARSEVSIDDVKFRNCDFRLPS